MSDRKYFVEARSTERNGVIGLQLGDDDARPGLAVIGLDGVARRVDALGCDEAFAKRVRRDERGMSESLRSRTYVQYGNGPIWEVDDAHFRRPATRVLAQRAIALKAAKAAAGAPPSDTPF